MIVTGRKVGRIMSWPCIFNHYCYGLEPHLFAGPWDIVFLYAETWTDLFSRNFKDIFHIHFVWYSWFCFCRALDPVVLRTESSQVVKQRVLNFVRSLSTVLASAYCLSRWAYEILSFEMLNEFTCIKKKSTITITMII